MKTVKAVVPYIYPGGINFKHKPYEVWVKLGGQTAPAHYPPRWLHGLAFRYELPRLGKLFRLSFADPPYSSQFTVHSSQLASLSHLPSFLRSSRCSGEQSSVPFTSEALAEEQSSTSNSRPSIFNFQFSSSKALRRAELGTIFNFPSEARLRFAQPWTIKFDTFPDYACYEIIPFFWDVWPENFEMTFSWLKRHNVRTAIFTSSQVAEMVRERFPEMNVLAVTEGIDVEGYNAGKPLKDRGVDFLEYGREIDRIVKYKQTDNINYVRGKRNGKPIFSREELISNLADAKVVAAYPKNWTDPELGGDIETLTQRYWEAMLSRCIMVGHAPQELIDFIGYNPVIELDKENPDKQLHDIIGGIADYQELVDKNRKCAIEKGAWNYSIRRVIDFLRKNGYSIHENR